MSTTSTSRGVTVPRDSDMDTESAILISQLALEDINDINNSRKGKRRSDAPLTDQEYALGVQEASLRSTLRLLQDLVFSRSLDRALTSDQRYIRALHTAEQGAMDDREAALALSRGQALPPLSASQRFLRDRTFSHPSRAENVQRYPADHGLEDNTAVSTPIIVPSSLEPRTSSSNRIERVECIACLNEIKSQSVQAPCGHGWCRDCLIDLVRACTRDESLFPLRCCKQNLPIQAISPLLNRGLLSIFQLKSTEFTTPSLARVYCPVPTCSAFLGPSTNTIAKVVCHRCRAVVCTKCKSKAHEGDDCVEHAAIGELKALAQKEHWQTCPGCNAIIELHQGCYHMTCRCRAQFCYLCAAPWKNCQCPQWDEDRLVDTAHQRVVNQFGERAAVAHPAEHDNRVRRAVAQLRVNHDCVSHNWNYRHGGGRCEECRHMLPSYLLLCGSCRMMACVRCARNRL